MARPACLYCGAALPAEVVAAAAESASLITAPDAAAPPQATWTKTLVVVDQSSGEVATLADALGLVPYEAALRHRRGGYALEGVYDPAMAEEEAARLRAAGLAVFLVPESVARAEPLVAHAGVRVRNSLSLRTATGPWEVSASDLLIVVRGPIVREYQAPLERRIRTARLEDGYRFHLHLRTSTRALELDPGDFDFGTVAPLKGSSFLEMSAWIESVAEGTPVDEAFRHSTPALGPTSARPSGPTAAAAALSGTTGPGKRNSKEGAVHDNLRQFRFYSSWRGALERARVEQP